MMGKISIIIPIYILNRDLYIMTTKCLKDVLDSVRHLDVEVIVIDDFSPKQKYIDMLCKVFPKINVFRNNENLGFAKSVNKGIKSSTGDLILLLNNDIEIKKTDWIEKILKE